MNKAFGVFLAIVAVIFVAGFGIKACNTPEGAPAWETCVANECFPGCNTIDDNCRACLQECVARYED